MTEIQLGAEGIRIAVIGVMFILVYAGPFRFARIANWRQDLFKVRNRLWDQMLATNSLQDPAHQQVRVLLNALIRAAPVLNLFYIIAVLRFIPIKSQESGRIPLHELIRQTKDPIARAALEAALAETLTLFLRQLFLNSFPGIFVGWPFYACLKISQYAPIWNWTRRANEYTRDRFRDIVEAFGRAASQSKHPFPSVVRA